MAQKVTEEEAKNKWCRHGFVFLHKESNHHGMSAASANRRSIDLSIMCRCVGSECMDWEWFTDPEEGKERVGFCDAQRSF